MVISACAGMLFCNEISYFKKVQFYEFFFHRLVVQRTKLVDQTQERMLELLEDMTSGTVEETKNFMDVCVKTIDR